MLLSAIKRNDVQLVRQFIDGHYDDYDDDGERTYEHLVREVDMDLARSILDKRDQFRMLVALQKLPQTSTLSTGNLSSNLINITYQTTYLSIDWPANRESEQRSSGSPTLLAANDQLNDPILTNQPD